MIDKKWENEARKENLLPVNRLARKFLKENGQVPDNQNLWVLQLFLWAQESDLVRPTDILDQSMGNLLSWKPSQVSKFLNLKSMSATAKNATELAEDLLNELDLAMSESVQGYPPLPPGSYR